MMLGVLAAAIRRASATPPSDPYWANVVSLLHFDNGVVDQKRVVWSLRSPASVTTTSPLRGTGSLLSGGGTSRLIANNAYLAIGVHDFTLELLVDALLNQSAPQYFLDRRANASVGTDFGVILLTTNAIRVYRQGVVNVTTPPLSGVGPYHVCIERVSGTLTIYVNGVAVASGPDSGSHDSTTMSLLTNSAGSVMAAGGKIDEVRLTVGVARYKGNFTPPSTPHPNG